MNFVTYDYIRLKGYLKFIYLAPHEVEVLLMLARAIINFKLFLEKNIIYLFVFTYSVINSTTISLIVLCCFAAIIFKSVFNSSFIVMCSFDSVISITSFYPILY